MSQALISASMSNIINSKVPSLSGEDNYAAWANSFRMVFVGLRATWLVGDLTAATVPADKTDLDAAILTQIWGKIDVTLDFLLDDVTTALGALRKIKAKFGTSTMGRRIKARHALHHVSHDPALDIGIYIQAVAKAVRVLGDLGSKVSETEQLDLLLMNLDSSWDTVRTTILSTKDEKTLDDVIGILNGSAISAVSIKSEPQDVALVAANRFPGRCGNPPSGSGTSGRRGTLPPPSDSSSSSVDSKGFRWCNPTNDRHCHRCGRTGHVAYLCIFDMPEEIKDWVMRGRSANFVDSGMYPTTVDEVADLADQMEYGGHAQGPWHLC